MKRTSNVVKIELAILMVLLAVAGVYGLRSWRLYQAVRQSEELFAKADLASEQGDYKASLGYLEQCLALNPIYFPAYELEADLYSGTLHQPDEALRTIKAALMKTDDPRLHKKLGELYLFTKHDFKKAQAELRIAADGIPEDLTCRTMLKRADAGAAQLPQ